MSDSSESYIVEAGGAIPIWISEAESVDNQGRPINSELEQQPQQFENIINPVKQSQQQQEQIPPSNTQARRGMVKRMKFYGINQKSQFDQNSYTCQLPTYPTNAIFLNQNISSNIHFDTGKVCLDAIKQYWTPQWTIENLIRSIRVMLLANPNAESQQIVTQEMFSFFSKKKMRN